MLYVTVRARGGYRSNLTSQIGFRLSQVLGRVADPVLERVTDPDPHSANFLVSNPDPSVELKGTLILKKKYSIVKTKFVDFFLSFIDSFIEFLDPSPK